MTCGLLKAEQDEEQEHTGQERARFRSTVLKV